MKILLLPKRHAGGDDKLQINLAWPYVQIRLAYIHAVINTTTSIRKIRDHFYENKETRVVTYTCRYSSWH